MQIAIIIIGSIVGLFALLLLVALFVKREYQISRNIIIHKDKASVFAYVKQLKNMDEYNKWVMQDPDKEQLFRGVDGTKGFVYGWNSKKKGGEGEQEIMDIQDGERVEMEIRFVRPFKAIARSAFATQSLDNDKTKVSLSFDSAMNYPMNIMFLFTTADKLLGPDMETSLKNLKSRLEA